MMCSMHWMSLKGMGGDMNCRIIGKTARFIVNLCDIMNGYIGKTISNCIVIMVSELFTMALFATIMVAFS